MSAIFKGFRLAAILVPALGASAANAAVIFNSLSLTTSTSATAKRGTTVDTHSDTKSTTLTTLPAGPTSVTSSISAIIPVAGVNRMQSNATSTVAAALWSASAGSFDVTTVDSLVQSLASTTAQPISGEAKAGSFAINYAFTVVGPKTFSLDYALFDPNFVGTTPLIASLTGPSGGFSNTIARNTDGSITSLLASGSYLLSLTSSFESQINRSGKGIGVTAGGSFDHFDFTIGAVPEPSAWAMMILGLGLTGYAMRRNPARARAMRLLAA